MMVHPDPSFESPREETWGDVARDVTVRLGILSAGVVTTVLPIPTALKAAAAAGVLYLDIAHDKGNRTWVKYFDEKLAHSAFPFTGVTAVCMALSYVLLGSGEAQ